MLRAIYYLPWFLVLPSLVASRLCGCSLREGRAVLVEHLADVGRYLSYLGAVPGWGLAGWMDGPIHLVDFLFFFSRLGLARCVVGWNVWVMLADVWFFRLLRLRGLFV